MSLALFREDLKTHEVGAAVNVAQMVFNLRRVGTPEYYAEREEIKNKLFGVFSNIADSQQIEITANWLAEYGVTGWDNVTDGQSDGSIKYSKQEARKIFLNKEYWISLNAALMIHGSNHENFLHKQAGTDAEELKKL